MIETKKCIECGKKMVLWPYAGCFSTSRLLSPKRFICHCGNQEIVAIQNKSFEQVWKEVNK